MRSVTFDRMASLGGYRKIGMFREKGGQVYIAEKIVHADDGVQYETLWAAGPDGENIDIAQKITSPWGITRDDRERLAREEGRKFLKLRDYYGDSRRK